MAMLLNILMLILSACSLLWAQSSTCNRDRMRQCEEAVRRGMQSRMMSGSRQEMSSMCRNLRDDFNCLLRETRCLSTESERSRNGDTIRNALKYIRDGCDTQGASWRDSSCYVGDGMKNCESSYPLGGSQYASFNPETCRKFKLFQDCVMDIVRTRCTSDDEILLGQYLVDSAQDLAWNCGESSSGSDLDRRRDDDRYDRFNDRSYDRYDRDRNRGSDRDRGRDQWTANYDRAGSRGGDRYSDRYSGSNGYRNAYAGSSDITCCRTERCDRSRLQQCRDSLSRAIDDRASGYQDTQKCRRTRDDFNCLLWQTSNCVSREERDRDNDIFRRARDYISRNCDTYGRWSENSCYKTTEIQRCENMLSNTRGGANYDSCRSYNSFKDCITDEISRRCTREDELYQGAYLVDKAQEMSWQCGTDSYNGRSQYSTYDRRDQYDRYDNGGGGYDSPMHLEDEDAMCLSRVKSYADQCKETLDEKRRQMLIENNYDVRERISCCSARQYRSCLYDTTRRICQSERSRVVDSLMGRFRYDLDKDTCRRIYDNDCDGSSHTQISFMLLTTCVAVVITLFALHL